MVDSGSVGSMTAGRGRGRRFFRISRETTQDWWWRKVERRVVALRRRHKLSAPLPIGPRCRPSFGSTGDRIRDESFIEVWAGVCQTQGPPPGVWASTCPLGWDV